MWWKMSSIKYARFKTEEELLKVVLHSLAYNVYPKVSAIGGRKISPSIDILQIERILILTDDTDRIGFRGR